jgi:hypothetical protein
MGFAFAFQTKPKIQILNGDGTVLKTLPPN